jgi:undecaprenyl-diphosphatase
MGGEKLLGLETELLLAMHQLGTASGPSWLPGAARALTALGGAPILNLWVVAAGVGLIVGDRTRIAARLFLVAYGGMIAGVVLKELFRRPRPILAVPLIDLPVSWSFPSGHAFDSAVVYLTLAAIVSRLTKARSIAGCAWALAIALTLLIGLTRVYLGVHYPTDVLAGWIAGSAWALGWEVFDRRFFRISYSSPARP